MKLQNVIGLIACGAWLTATPGLAAAQDGEAGGAQQTHQAGQQQAGQHEQERTETTAAQDPQHTGTEPYEGTEAAERERTRTELERERRMAPQDDAAAAAGERAGEEQAEQDAQRADDPAARPAQARADAPAERRIGFRELRDNPEQYYGQTVTFEANVDDVLGPRLLRISSTAFFDWFGGGLLAYAPEALGISATDRDRVTITGTAERYDRQALEHEWAWIDPGDEVDDRLKERPVVRITSVETRDGRNALVHDAETFAAEQQFADPQAQERPVGTAGEGEHEGERDRDITEAERDRDRTEDARDPQAVGTAGDAGRGVGTEREAGADAPAAPEYETFGTAGERHRHTHPETADDAQARREPVARTVFGAPIHDEDAIQDIGGIFGARRADVGRHVHLTEVRIERTLGDRLFLAWTDRDDQKVLVKVPQQVDATPELREGQTISLQGVVMQTPRNATRLPGVEEADARAALDREVYVLATNLHGSEAPE